MISLIAAVASNGTIGDKNNLPWHLPEDLRRFKDLTSGKTVIMGRKTFESIFARLGKALPNRTNVVITRQTEVQVPEGVIVQSSIEDALRSYGGADVFVIGGGEIYRQTIDLADRLYITHVDKEVPGDTQFPQIDSTKWRVLTTEKHEGYSFVIYEKTNH
jgi:dihydrofolate reductase